MEQKGPRFPLPATRSLREASEAESASIARQLDTACATLAFSLFSDSSLEHYRGGFYNPVMYAGPAVSACLLGVSAVPSPRLRRVIGATAILTGIVGTGFHAWNIVKREGGLSWLNLFYAAPALAPAGVSIGGVLLICSDAARRNQIGTGGARLLAAGTAIGLLGTAAEAALFHFRGAFHNKAMYIPVVIPPLAGAMLMKAALTGRSRRSTRVLLRATAAAGLAGSLFHALAISREMGGWRNWKQNLQAGPPIPAPPSFTGIALAGLAALRLMKGAR